MTNLSSPRLSAWLDKGALHTLSSRLGEHEIFCIDDNPQRRTETILLIHGFPTSSFDFSPIWKPLSEGYRLLTLDMLGFGFSDKPNHRNYTIHQQADLVEAWLSETEAESFHVVAHDYGVSVAQELLARQIEDKGEGRWQSCTFLNGGLFPETHRALLIQKLMLSPLGKWINKFTGFKQFSSSFSRVFGHKTQPSEQELRDFWEVINVNEGKHLFHNLMTYILDRRKHRLRWLKALQDSPVPLALINGSVDPVSGAHLVDRYKELNCRLDFLSQLDEIGHYPQVEAPQEVHRAVLEFVGDQTR